MMIRCLIDTNVLIDYLGGNTSSAFVLNVEQALSAGSVVSVITTMELLGWRGHSEQSRCDAENLLRGMGEIGLARPVVNEVIKLRSLLAIKLPDAIIAASALVEKLPVMTANTSDFKSIPGLSLLNPTAP
ncbi:type II toxin-antitoxin system VapC family toxin [Propionivibrio sp.]|uniref:type II toxin-antitoxin system VapC family toxin n=1 Tax=Propionivibrio sp. TaxID=2212460 RepID=UPI003BF3798D